MPPALGAGGAWPVVNTARVARVTPHHAVNNARERVSAGGAWPVVNTAHVACADDAGPRRHHHPRQRV
jgi:hypothetical protein